jgi:hypothetical protein
MWGGAFPKKCGVFPFCGGTLGHSPPKKGYVKMHPHRFFLTASKKLKKNTKDQNSKATKTKQYKKPNAFAHLSLSLSISM